MQKRLVVDLNQLVLQSGKDRSPKKERLRVYLTEVVKAATALESRSEMQSALRCRRYQESQVCPGYLRVRLQDIPPTVFWQCPDCNESGIITNWNQTPWDLSRIRRGRARPQYTFHLRELHYRELLRVSFMDPECDRLVFSAQATDDMIAVSGPLESFAALRGDVSAQARLDNRRQRQEILDDISGTLDEFIAASGDPAQIELRNAAAENEAILQLLPLFPPELSQRLEESLKDQNNNLDVIDQYFAEFVNSCRNRTGPQTSLSPLDVRRLTESNWRASDGAIRLQRLLPADAARTQMVRDSQAFLSGIERAGVVKSTAKGNLNRRFVAEMIERMPSGEEYRDDCQEEVRKHWDERYFFELHIIRLLCEWRRLIKNHRGGFRLTSKGQRLLKSDSGGELHFELFLAFFGKLNLAYLDRLPENERLESTLAYCLYVLGQEAQEWRTVQELTPSLLLPIAKEDPDPQSCESRQIETRLIRPLIKFGLLERAPRPREDSLLEIVPIRKSPLYDRFIGFNL